MNKSKSNNIFSNLDLKMHSKGLFSTKNNLNSIDNIRNNIEFKKKSYFKTRLKSIENKLLNKKMIESNFIKLTEHKKIFDLNIKNKNDLNTNKIIYKRRINLCKKYDKNLNFNFKDLKNNNIYQLEKNLESLKNTNLKYSKMNHNISFEFHNKESHIINKNIYKTNIYDESINIKNKVYKPKLEYTNFEIKFKELNLNKSQYKDNKFIITIKRLYKERFFKELLIFNFSMKIYKLENILIKKIKDNKYNN